MSLTLIIILLAIFAIIRSFIKGTFWRSSLTCGLGGAAVGILLVLLLSWYVIYTAKGDQAFAGLIVAFVGGPIAATIGAILFISIGAARRKRYIDSHTSKGSTHQSTVSEFQDVSTQPDDSTSTSIAAEGGNKEPHFGYKLGSIVERATAFLAERIIIFILLTVILGDDFYRMRIVSLEGLLSGYLYIIVGIFLVAPALFSALFYPIWSSNLGHKLLGLKVISSVDGSDFNQAISGAGRELLKAAMSLIFIPVAWLVSDSDRQNLYDKRVNTYVVKRHEAIGNRGIVIRGLLLVVMILMVIFQYGFYSLLHPGINKDIIGKWVFVSDSYQDSHQIFYLDFADNGTVDNHVFIIANGQFEPCTYSVNYSRYPFSMAITPVNYTGPNSIIHLKVKFLSENELSLYNSNENITLNRLTSARHYTDAKPHRTDRFPEPENKISNEELKQFWKDKIEAIINLDLNRIASQTSLPFVVVNNEGVHQRSLFFNPHASYSNSDIVSNYADSLNNLKEIFPGEMRAGLRDMDYTNISQVQVNNGEIMLMINFLGEKYSIGTRGNNGNYLYPRYGLLFEKRNGKWMFCGQSSQWDYSWTLEQNDEESAEVSAAVQDKLVEAKLNHDIQIIIQERNLQAIIDLDQSKIINQTHFPLEGNWGQALGLKGDPGDWTKEDLTTNLSKMFYVQYRDNLSSVDTPSYSKKPPLTFENADVIFNEFDFDNAGVVHYSTQNKINDNHCCTRMTFKKVENEWKLVRLDLD